MMFRTTVAVLCAHLIACAPHTESPYKPSNGNTEDPNAGYIGGSYDLGKGRQDKDSLGLVGALLGCGKSQYSCQTQSLRPVCVGLDKLCDGVKDCPSGEDETNSLCLIGELESKLGKPSKEGTENDFSGTGFMFSVDNLVVSGNSRVKMFNQESDNTADKGATQVVVNDGGQSQQQEQQQYGR